MQPDLLHFLRITFSHVISFTNPALTTWEIDHKHKLMAAAVLSLTLDSDESDALMVGVTEVIDLSH